MRARTLAFGMALGLVAASCDDGDTNTAHDSGTEEDHGSSNTSDTRGNTDDVTSSTDTMDHNAEAGTGSSAASTETSGNDASAEVAFASIPNPALIVANGGNETVTVIDPSTMTVVGTVSVMEGMHPHHLGISPDKTRVLITATSADLSVGHGASAHEGHGAAASTMVYQLDVTSGQFRDVVTIEATAHNALFTPDGETVVLGMMEHGMIVGYDSATFVESFTADGFEMPLEVTPTASGTLLIAESGASRVALFDLATRATLTTFEVGPVPVAAWASGGPNYFVSVEEGMQVKHLVEGDEGVTFDGHTIELEGMPGQAILTPNGNELWVAVEDRGVIATFDAITHESTGEFSAGTKPHGIAFEPDGSRAFVTDEDGGKLLVVTVADRSIASEVALGGKPNGVVWLSK